MQVVGAIILGAFLVLSADAASPPANNCQPSGGKSHRKLLHILLPWWRRRHPQLSWIDCNSTTTSTVPPTTTLPPHPSHPPPPTRIYNNPHFFENRSVIVHLHEWTFLDIARECEDFLGPYGYGGVQTSPVSENVILSGRPWYERYQPISYRIASRSGDANDFHEMTRRCRDVGVRIYVDVIPNHMTGNVPHAIGTGGSIADPINFEYPSVPFGAEDFNQPTCQISDYDDPLDSRVCELVALHDLNQTMPRVQWAIVNFLDRLTGLGAAGFRIDAAKHMFPNDLQNIFANIRNLSKYHGFADGSAPFIFQEVNGAILKFDYTHLGAVTEFAHASNMAKFFKNQSRVVDLRNYGGRRMGMLESGDALVFVDNHDLQRQNAFTLNYKSPREFRAANAFTLAHPYGIVRVMSSFEFDDDQQGPPHDGDYNIVPPVFDDAKQSVSGWVAEHRWPAIANMVRFRNVVGDSPLTNWWDDGDSVLAFCRGQRGFVAVSAGNYDFKGRVHTCLPSGVYCDSISSSWSSSECATDSRITVNYDGTIFVDLPKSGENLALALHIDNRIGERELLTSKVDEAKNTQNFEYKFN